MNSKGLALARRNNLKTLALSIGKITMWTKPWESQKPAKNIPPLPLPLTIRKRNLRFPKKGREFPMTSGPIWSGRNPRASQIWN